MSALSPSHERTARELGAIQAYLSSAEIKIRTLEDRLTLAREAVTLLEQAFEQLDCEDHPMAELVYQAGCLARGYRHEKVMA